MKLLICEILQMNEITQKKVQKKISKMSILKMANMFSIHEKLLHKYRHKYQENEKNELSYCAFVKAIQITHENEKMLQTKNFKDLTLEEIDKLANQEIENLTSKERRKNVRERLIKYLPIMLVWKREGVSFRKIRDELEEKYNEEVSLSSVYNILKELL